MVTENHDVIAKLSLGGTDALVQGMVRNQQIRVKIATHARFDFRVRSVSGCASPTSADGFEMETRVPMGL
jgi:hypothetical protein